MDPYVKLAAAINGEVLLDEVLKWKDSDLRKLAALDEVRRDTKVPVNASARLAEAISGDKPVADGAHARLARALTGGSC